ncbi:DUF6286 domain-containing protein [Mycobacterium sp. NPDC050551]|uniref:DUF6286 domain-containing protein n=1 Tax=Mycobacterium sp. NPDC050551 TaxID=3155407 RepID=UPI00342D08A5
MSATDTETTDPSAGTGPDVRPASEPLRAAGARYAGVVIALAVTGAGGLALREAAVGFGQFGGSPWLPAAAAWLGEPKPVRFVTAAAVLAALVGVACLVVAVKPRRRRGLRVAAGTAVFVDYADLVRMVSTAAESVPGVIDARSSVGRRSVSVRCAVAGSCDQIREQVLETVSAELSALAAQPRIKVKTEEKSR